MGPPAEGSFKDARRRRMSVAAGQAAEAMANSSIQKFSAQIESLLHVKEQEQLSAVCEVRLPPADSCPMAPSRPDC